MFAKLDGQSLVSAPKSVTVHFNPPPEWWLEQNGYLEVCDAPKPDGGLDFAFEWKVADGKIVKVWSAIEPGEVAGG